jgi:hypothetical protein
MKPPVASSLARQNEYKRLSAYEALILTERGFETFDVWLPSTTHVVDVADGGSTPPPLKNRGRCRLKTND